MQKSTPARPAAMRSATCSVSCLQQLRLLILRFCGGAMWAVGIEPAPSGHEPGDSTTDTAPTKRQHTHTDTGESPRSPRSDHRVFSGLWICPVWLVAPGRSGCLAAQRPTHISIMGDPPRTPRSDYHITITREQVRTSSQTGGNGMYVGHMICTPPPLYKLRQSVHDFM